MIQINFKTPLAYPKGKERTPPGHSAYNSIFSDNMTVAEALNYLNDELESINASNATLYSNYEDIKNSSRMKRGTSEGAAVSFDVLNRSCHIACDKWRSLAHNIYALQLAVRHVRLFEEWGICSAGHFIAGLTFYDRRAPQANVTKRSHNSGNQERRNSPEWMQLLGLGETATLSDANAMYRHKAKQTANDEDALIALNRAIDEARHALSA